MIGALKIEKDDERSAIADLVAKIVKAQYELEDFTKSSREKLSEAAKAELSTAIQAFLPDAPLTWMIDLGADAVAAELAAA